MASSVDKGSGFEKNLALPDPYGEGFEHSEDPLEHTKQQWATLEKRTIDDRATCAQTFAYDMAYVQRLLSSDFCIHQPFGAGLD